MATGTNFQLVFGPGTWGFNSDANRDCDFDKEPNKVLNKIERPISSSSSWRTGGQEERELYCFMTCP